MALKLAFLLLENKTKHVFTGRSQGAQRHVVFVLSLSPAFLYFFFLFSFYIYFSIYIFQVVIMICFVRKRTSPRHLKARLFFSVKCDVNRTSARAGRSSKKVKVERL